MQAKLPLDENDKRQLVLKLMSQLRCSECGRLYKREDFALVHRGEDIWLLNARCPECSQSSHVIIFMQLDAQRDLAIDLTLEELRQAGDWSPITFDDVLDVHALLEEFDGDFEELLAS
jgi:DNA-directed RNA polymerase subunit RPC12/RpoP